MRLLIYEHVTAGGLGPAASQALLGEADAMVKSLARDFLAIDGLEVSLLRCPSLAPMQWRGRGPRIEAGGHGPGGLSAALQHCDAVLLVAPESGHSLHRLSLEVESARIPSLGARPGAIAIASDKWLTWLALESAGVAQIPTLRADAVTHDARGPAGRWVLKPALGCGCEGIRVLPDRSAAVAAARGLGPAAREWIVQPWLDGTAASLTLLGHRGGIELLAVNRQRIRVAPAGDVVLDGVDVGVLADVDGALRDLARQVAAALPGLRGLFGIDVLLTATGPRVVEVNPRVTSAWPGLAAHLGSNPAERWWHHFRDDARRPGGAARPQRAPLAPRMAAQSESMRPPTPIGQLGHDGAALHRVPDGRRVIGWDLGGAHLKVAALDADRGLIEVIQEPCALWLGLDRLVPLLRRLTARWGRPLGHAITMSGEMVDLFPDRNSGVQALIAAMVAEAGEVPVSVYAGGRGFLAPGDCAGHEAAIASANWLAAGEWAARQIGAGILLDIGSTTTDVLCFHGGTSLPAALGDSGRLASDELVYTGVTRTPLMALAQRVPVGGRSLGLMAEWFASTADVYRLLGELPADADQHPTADGAAKSVAASQRRLARMVGCDGHEYPPAEWQSLAAFFRRRQLDLIRPALELAVQRLAHHCAAGAPVRAPASAPEDSPLLVTAGVGRFLATELAADLGLDCVDFGQLAGLAAGSPELADRASCCAPAVAVAALLGQSARSASATR